METPRFDLKKLLDSLNHDLRLLAERDDLTILEGPIDGFLWPERDYLIVQTQQLDGPTKRIRCDWKLLGGDEELDVVRKNQASVILNNIWKAFKTVAHEKEPAHAG